LEKVIYNEKNTGVVELFKDVLFNGITEKYYQWVSRDVFYANRHRNDWFGGFCQIVWSFNHNQKGYRYGRKVEYYKYLLHRIVVDDDKEAAYILYHKYGLSVPHFIDDDMDWFERVKSRRRQLRRAIKKQLQQDIYNRLGFKKSKDHTSRLQHLEIVEGLRYISLLSEEYKDKLIIHNRSYDEIEIDTPPENTIIYLDPPYFNQHYQIGIDKDRLFNWIKLMSTKGYPIYVSEYEFDGLECIWEKERVNIYSSKRNKVYERLFSNHNLL